MKKFYVSCPQLGVNKMKFKSESDRNEMALSLWQEYCYCLEMRVMNWYGEDGMYSGIAEDASANVFTWKGWF
jgi:hypothetical protein